MNYELFLIIPTEQRSSTKFERFVVNRMECRAAATVGSSLAQSARTTAPRLQAFICFSGENSKRNFRCGNLLPTAKIYLLFSTRMKLPFRSKKFPTKFWLEIFSDESYKSSGLQILKKTQFLVIPSRVLARLSHLEIKCCASLSVWSWVWEWVGPTHVISLSNREGSERANITHCIPYTFLSPSLGAPGQNKTFSETLMFREVRTEELGVAQITKIRSTDTISLWLLEVVALTREEGQSDNEIMTIKR